MYSRSSLNGVAPIEPTEDLVLACKFSWSSGRRALSFVGSIFGESIRNMASPFRERFGVGGKTVGFVVGVTSSLDADPAGAIGRGEGRSANEDEEEICQEQSERHLAFR